MTNRLIILFCLIFFTFSTVDAQNQRVYESQKQMSLGIKPCFTMDVRGAETKALENSWETFAKQKFGTKLKRDRKTGEWSATDVQTKATGKDPGNLYANVEKTSSGAALNLWFDYGNEFLSRDTRPNQTEETIQVLEEFDVHARRDMIAAELAAENKILKNNESELVKLQKEDAKLRESIVDYQEKIKQAEEKLIVNAESQKAAQGKVETQKQRTKSVQDRLDSLN